MCTSFLVNNILIIIIQFYRVYNILSIRGATEGARSILLERERRYILRHVEGARAQFLFEGARPSLTI